MLVIFQPHSVMKERATKKFRLIFTQKISRDTTRWNWLWNFLPFCIPTLNFTKFIGKLITNITNNNIVNYPLIWKNKTRWYNKEDRSEISSQVELLLITRGRSTECYHCGIKDHLKKDCRHHKNTKKPTNGTASQGCATSTRHLKWREILYSKEEIGPKGRIQLNDVRTMDASATWHMTPHQIWVFALISLSQKDLCLWKMIMS